MRTKPSLGSDDAERIVVGCLESARRAGVAVAVCVVDDAGELLHFQRMDAARGYTATFAMRKARAAARAAAPTSAIEASFRERQAHVPSAVAGPGGIPVRHGSECAGAVGVSGAKPEIDERIAIAGVEALRASSA